MIPLCPIDPHWFPSLSLLAPQAQVVANNDEKRTFSVTYVPKVAGLHKVGDTNMARLCH